LTGYKFRCNAKSRLRGWGTLGRPAARCNHAASFLNQGDWMGSLRYGWNASQQKAVSGKLGELPGSLEPASGRGLELEQQFERI